MENPSSPLDTLRQLKEMLDAGALTPTEFEALKQRLVFTPAAPGTAAPAAASPPDAPAAYVPPVAPAAAAAAPVPPAPSAPSAAFPNQPPPNLPPLAPNLPPPVREVPTAAAAFAPVSEPLFRPGIESDFQVAAPEARYEEEEDALADENTPDFASPPAERSSSLGLVLAIGAVLVFLAVVAYLGFTRPASEHISSTSQTAADSVATTIETGPQVAPLPTTAAVPETVRVAPTNPAPALPSRAELERQAAAVRDSAAPEAAPVASDSTVRQ